MDSYIVRIYRRAGRKHRILIGIIETAGTRRKIAFTNIEDLWEILRCRKGRDLCAPPSPQRRLRKEVVSGKAGTGLGESAKGASHIKNNSGESFSLKNEKEK
jgi:hypothetical protein